MKKVDAMKDEYDFSGAVRGKFYRPDAQLAAPVHLDPTGTQPATKTHQGKRLTSPSAIEFAEMHLIRECLDEAGRAFKLYFKLLADKAAIKESDNTVRLALFRDGLVQIMACFSTNPTKRSNFLIPSEAFAGIEGWQEFYKWMRDYRDAFAAHNFGVKRQSEAIGIFNSDTNEFLGVGHFTMMSQGEDLGAEHSIRLFWSAAARHVKTRIADLEAVLIEEAKKLSPPEIAALEPARLVVPGNQDIRTSREKYRKRPNS